MPLPITTPQRVPKWGPSSISPSPGGVWPASPQPSSETQNQGVDLRKIMEEEDKGKEKSQSR
jgi:hypothetical protein